MRRDQRLRRPEQFGRVRREGKTWAHPLLVINVARNRTGRTRYGFVVSKHLGKAHDRNRAKRRTREAARLAAAHVMPGWDIVFIVRAPVLEAPFEVLARAVEELLRRAGLWTTPRVVDGTPHANAARPSDHPPVSAPLTPDPA